MVTAKKSAPKKAATPSTPAAAAPPEPLLINGIPPDSGDVKGGGSAKKGLISFLPLKAITIVKGFNPRTSVDKEAVADLAQNMKQVGQLSSIVVRPGAKNGTFELMAGERRVQAAILLGWEHIAASVRSDLVGDEERAKAVAVAENADGDTRHGLNPIEMGRVFTDLETKSWTVDRITKETGVKVHKIRRCLQLVKAPADIQKKVESGDLSMMAALEVYKLDDATRAKIADQLKDGISPNEVKRVAKAAAKEDHPEAVDGKQAKKKTGASRDASLTAWKGSRQKQAAIIKLAYVYHTAPEDTVGTMDWHELRGSLAFALWDRGDITDFSLPNRTTSDEKEVKQLAQFAKIVEAEAKKYKTEETAEATADAAPAAKGKKKAAAKG